MSQHKDDGGYMKRRERVRVSQERYQLQKQSRYRVKVYKRMRAEKEPRHINNLVF